ncbi:rRNA maturation RNase YbeY [Patiriisocius hiemis]|uniref:Endoribonuclease YbeY n=1 Tax=Patiriisocius hiemis TaxID=3075604 RepID=A0ABU2YBL9_9FLAO|nr:rRNA maturation RNase YbeY [Constantimarinum sp. W242]MDT0555586.1 rRNA maturation RNase YbeY [Constantimarinum sp. W242]
MINFFSETDFELSNTIDVSNWIHKVINGYDKKLGEIVYVFCDDDYLHKLNMSFLNHNTLTDIITFDNSLGSILHGEIYISIDRVKENAKDFDTSFLNELYRVVIHGILHLCGLKDKTEKEEKEMRIAEETALSLLKNNYTLDNQ